MNFDRRTLALVATVPDTFRLILKEQPRELNKYFNVVVISSHVDVAKYAQELGIQYEIVPMRRGIAPFADVVAIIRMIGVLRTHKPDIVHSFTPKAGLVASIAGKVCGVQSRMHTFTGLIFPTAKFGWRFLLRWIDKLISSNCSQVIAEGRGVQHQLKSYKVCDDAIVLGNGNIAGIDETFFSADDFHFSEVSELRKLSIDPNWVLDKTIFLFIGRINRDKGIEDLFRAVSLLDPEKYLCLIVGNFDCPTAYENFLRDRYIRNNPNIILAGFFDDVRIALKLGDCLVLPSYREGFPNVLLQAGSMSKASIASDIPGSNEIISDGYNGFIVKPGCPDALAQKMRHFMGLSTEERKAIGIQARQNIVDKYRRSDYEEILINFYRSLPK